MKKLLSFFSLIALMVAFTSCEEDDGCVTCTSMDDPNLPAKVYCEADGDYVGLSEKDFIANQFAAGWDCQ